MAELLLISGKNRVKALKLLWFVKITEKYPNIYFVKEKQYTVL